MVRIASGEDSSEPPRQMARIAAARLLLAKALPDLSSVEMTGMDGGPLKITIIKEC